jgi:hypothetical protein
MISPPTLQEGLLLVALALSGRADPALDRSSGVRLLVLTPRLGFLAQEGHERLQ